MKKQINIGTLNTQGCRNTNKIHSIAKDADKFNLQVLLALTETHIADQIIEKVKVNKKTYNVYHNGIAGKNIYAGVGILLEDIPAVFSRILDRICVAEVNLRKSVMLYIIVCYAPTMDVSEKNPKVRDDFYQSLSQVTSKLIKVDI